MEFPVGTYHVGIDKSTHGYNFQNNKEYLFGFWARTLSGTRTITPLMTEHDNSTTSGATFTIDTNWKWIVIRKTFTSQIPNTTNPRCFYSWDSVSTQGAFQVYGAMIVETNEAGGQFSFLPTSPHSFTYDDDGNMTYDGQWGYAYDAENRPYWMETNANAVTAGAPRLGLALTYDHAGRRIRKVSYRWDNNINNWTLVSDTKFVYDGWNLIAELDATSTSLPVVRTYTWGLDLSGSTQGAGGVGGLLMTKGSFKNSETGSTENGKTLLAVHDAMGNVHGMVSTSTVSGSGSTTYAVGSLVASYEYDAFGKTLREEGPYAAANPFRYSTKYTDNETGLVYYGMRYYAPSLGRFINRDPIAERGGLNLYGFVANNGVNRVDFLGMMRAKIRRGCHTISGSGAFEFSFTTCDFEIEVDDGADPFSGRVGLNHKYAGGDNGLRLKFDLQWQEGAKGGDTKSEDDLLSTLSEACRNALRRMEQLSNELKTATKYKNAINNIVGALQLHLLDVEGNNAIKIMENAAALLQIPGDGYASEAFNLSKTAFVDLPMDVIGALEEPGFRSTFGTSLDLADFSNSVLKSNAPQVNRGPLKHMSKYGYATIWTAANSAADYGAYYGKSSNARYHLRRFQYAEIDAENNVQNLESEYAKAALAAAEAC